LLVKLAYAINVMDRSLFGDAPQTTPVPPHPGDGGASPPHVRALIRTARMGAHLCQEDDTEGLLQTRGGCAKIRFARAIIGTR
jgi:hypothetical protein